MNTLEKEKTPEDIIKYEGVTMKNLEDPIKDILEKVMMLMLVPFIITPLIYYYSSGLYHPLTFILSGVSIILLIVLMRAGKKRAWNSRKKWECEYERVVGKKIGEDKKKGRVMDNAC